MKNQMPILDYQKEILSRLTQETHTGSSDPNCWELILENGETLSLKELKILNELGFVYHSEQTDIEYETGNGSVSYMDIYYFAKVENVKDLFYDCVPY